MILNSLTSMDMTTRALVVGTTVRGQHSMEPCSKILLVALAVAALSNASFIHGHNVCPIFSSPCGKVVYPFKFKNQTAPNNCTYFDLTCNATTGAATLSLPTGGEFCVVDIDYVRRYIQLCDPGDCLFRRLMAMNSTGLNFSPFKAVAYQDYMFYVCPLDSPALMGHLVYVIDCLRNDPFDVTVATREPSSNLINCTAIGSLRIPSLPQEDGDGFNPDNFFHFTWDDVECRDCQEYDYGKSTAGAYFMPAILALSCCLAFSMYLVRIFGNKTERDNAATETGTGVGAPQDTTTLPPPPPLPPPLPSTTTNNNTRGFDESRIMACTELVVVSEESGENIPSGNKNNNVCSICLDNCCGQGDTVRVINKCGHCFHDGCLQQWLAKNCTCPVCRTCLSHP